MGQGGALPSVPVAELDLGRVDAVPVRHLQRRDSSLGQQPLEFVPNVERLIAPSAMSASSECTVSTASDLFVPITPVGPRLIQPVAYSSVEKSPVADDPALRVGHPSGGVVEGHPVQPHPAIADGADDELGRRWSRPTPGPLDQAVSVQGRALDLHRLDPLRHRESGRVGSRSAGRSAGRAPTRSRPAKSCSTTRLRAATLSRPTTASLDASSSRVSRVDDHVDPGISPELAQLLGGEGGVRGAAPAQDVHVGDPLVGQRLQHLVGHVGVGRADRRS